MLPNPFKYVLSIKANIDKVSLNIFIILFQNSPPFSGILLLSPVVLLKIFCCIDNKCFLNFSSLFFSSLLFTSNSGLINKSKCLQNISQFLITIINNLLLCSLFVIINFSLNSFLLLYKFSSIIKSL